MLTQQKIALFGFVDKAHANGSPEEQMAIFRAVRDEMRRKVLQYLINLSTSCKR